MKELIQKESIQDSLSFSCANNRVLVVEKFLTRYDNVNILYNDGSCFYSAIKHNNPDMLKLLINYYMKNINSNTEKRTLGEIGHIHSLKTVIKDIEEQIDIPKELEGILHNYGLLDSNDYSSSEESLSDSDLEQSIEDFSFQVDDNFPASCSFQIYDGNEENGKNWLDLSGQNIVTTEG